MMSILTDIYDEHFDGCSGFILRYAPLDECPGWCDSYKSMLAAADILYSDPDKGVRNAFDEAFAEPPTDWLRCIDCMDDKGRDKLFSTITTLCHLYRWNYLPAPKSEYCRTSIELPLGLKRPLQYLSGKLNRPPCGSIWSTTTSNYVTDIADPGEDVDIGRLCTDNIAAMDNWLCGKNKSQLETWVKVFVLFEAKAHDAIIIADRLVKAASQARHEDVACIYKEIETYIYDLIKIFANHVSRVHLDAKLWREIVQPTFAWGLISGGERLEGASGLQLGSVQIIDILLCTPRKAAMAKAAVDSRRYMPTHHRLLLNAIEREVSGCNMPEMIRSNPDIKMMHAKCTSNLIRFRIAHKNIGKIYIRGDGEEKDMITTGLTVDAGQNAEELFSRHMNEMIEATGSFE